jgi:Subtilase family/Peptidase inhibitor I9
MRGRGVRSWFVAVVAVVALPVLGGIALAARAAKHHRSLSATQVLSGQSGSRVRVIVVLRNQLRNLPPNAHLMRARSGAVAVQQRPLQAAVRSSGGRITHSFHAVNAFSAVVSRAERARLAANPSVAQVVPDSFVSAPDPSGAPTTGAAGAIGGGPAQAVAASTTAAPVPATSGSSDPGSGAAVAVGSGQVCPSDPAHPIVAPEGLSLINAPQAQQIATGAGVKVAFIAEGIDPANPDFIRPDGSRVIADYRDFTGQGTNAPTTGGEAFGDASTIAAQGTFVHDLSKFTNPSHPLPRGCNIVLRGVAPGASLVAMKVFPTYNGVGGGAFNSTILQGLDWAVSVDHVNVLNESFGGAGTPDTLQDVLKAFNAQAEQAGVVVTTSTGDQGTANSIGSPASGPAGIAAGATTQFQGLAQTTRGGYQLSPNGWLNDNIANFSSAGFTQLGKTLDLVAPGNESFEACTPDPAQYADCKTLGGGPSDLSTFGGTSEAAPMTAGVAALVIQAYRDTHGGASPSPQLVKQIIVSNADDLNIPSQEQGAGQLNALAAVQAAESIGRTGVGDGRLVSPSQLDLSAPAGSATGGDVTLTNDGAATQTFGARLRTLQAPISDTHVDKTLDTATDPQYLDYKGVPQAYVKFTFTVPTGADRLDGAIAWPGDPAKAQTVNMTLFDPSGRMAAFTYLPNGSNSNYAHIDVRNPSAGTWTAVLSTPKTANAYNGVVHCDLAASRFATLGAVTPSSVTLAPGQSASLHVSLNAPSTPGDYSRDVELSDSSGKTSVAPVVLRSLVPLSGGTGSFSGVFTGGNGNGFPAREDTFAFDVPRGAPALNVQYTLPNEPNTLLFAFLTSPTGQAVGQQLTQSSGTQTLQLYQRDPMPGRWLVTISAFNPVGGTTTAQPFSGTVSLHAPPVSATGVPNSPRDAVPAGGSVVAHVQVSNPGNAPLTVFIDPRLRTKSSYPLQALTQATNVALPLNTLGAPPTFVAPTEANLVFAATQATAPVTMEFGFGAVGEGDPDLVGISRANGASGTFSAPEVVPGEWFVAPSLTGPFSGPASGTANTGMVAEARTFDQGVTSSTGDLELDYVDPSAPPATPVTVNPGQTVTIPVTFSAGSRRHGVVRGDLFVDDATPLFSANEVAAIPYAFQVR